MSEKKPRVTLEQKITDTALYIRDVFEKGRPKADLYQGTHVQTTRTDSSYRGGNPATEVVKFVVNPGSQAKLVVHSIEQYHPSIAPSINCRVHDMEEYRVNNPANPVRTRFNGGHTATLAETTFIFDHLAAEVAAVHGGPQV